MTSDLERGAVNASVRRAVVMSGCRGGLWFKGIGSVYKRHPVTKFEHGNHGASKRKFNHMTIY